MLKHHPRTKQIISKFIKQQTLKIIYYQMNSLKNALSTQQSPNKQKAEYNHTLFKAVNKSKNAAFWALDIDNNEQSPQQSLSSDNLMKILYQKLQAAFQKDIKNISEVAFERIIEEFQDDAGGSKSQLSYLMVIEDKLADIIQFSKDQFQKFLNTFNQMLQDKINRLRKKQKKVELSNFEKIVNNNFKKKTEDTPYLTVEETKPHHMREITSKSPRKESSVQNKLVRLFSKDKNPLKERQLKESLKKEDDSILNATTDVNRNESVSFSNVLATSVAVKSRRRKESTELRQKKAKAKKQQKYEMEKDEGDEAFMFFRPKKGKK